MFCVFVVKEKDHSVTPKLIRTVSSLLSVACLLSQSPRLSAQSGAKNGEWRSYGGDTGSTRYSPPDQINPSNFNKLEVAGGLNAPTPPPPPPHPTPQPP